MYIASVFLYIYLKKKKEQPSAANSEDLNKNFSREGKELDTVKNASLEPVEYFMTDILFIAHFLKDKLYFFTDPNDFHNLRSSYRRNSSLGPSVEFMDNPEPHVVKSNPLMKHFMSFNENGGFMSDSSDAESVNVHNDSQNHLSKNFLIDDGKNANMMNSDNGDCLPQEDVSITEDSDKQGDNNRTFHNGNVRRKLYFNPAYFEPNLLASPPPSAIEFLTKIREVITMAKGKMAAKRFQPCLNGIPEEISYLSGSEIYSPGTMNSRKSSIVSSRRTSSKDCTGCPGCEAKKSSETNTPQKNCKNCGDKQKSIQKWLENVSTATDSSGSSDSSSMKKKKKLFISLPIMEEDREELIMNDDDEDKIENFNENIDVITKVSLTLDFKRYNQHFVLHRATLRRRTFLYNTTTLASKMMYRKPAVPFQKLFLTA